MSDVTPQQAFDIAMAHHQAGRLAEAEAIYRQLLAISPQNPDLWHLLGVVAHGRGDFEEGRRLIQSAIDANPGAFIYHNNLGLVLTEMGRCEEAVGVLREAIRLQPQTAETHHNLGIALGALGRAEESVQAHRAALSIRPGYAEAQLNLGNALVAAGRRDEAIAHYRAILSANPHNAAVANNLGNLLKDLARLDDAAAFYRQALASDPGDPEAWSNLGVVRLGSGDTGEAMECFRRSLALNPGLPEVRSNLIFTRYFDPATTTEALIAEHRRWNEVHAAPAQKSIVPHTNDPVPDRRLRIGYVSVDLRDHVVGRTLLPCFEAHDRERFDIVCYSGTGTRDAIAERFRRGSVLWRETSRFRDENFAAQIREDRIDILVDLGLHTAHNRLPVFARRPAPVQISWLGYPGPAGLDAIGFYLSDPFLDPPAHRTHSPLGEPLLLPDCWCGYGPTPDSPDPGPLPAAACAHVTFGSFNNVAKINPQVLALWAAILRRVPGSRLRLLSKAGRIAHIVDALVQHGVAPERVEFLDYEPSAEPGEPRGTRLSHRYLQRYLDIDIALDPFPYNGMTTTCDSLWMGVPVVALIGDHPISRASFSLLSNVGLHELAAPSRDAYADLAVTLALDLPRLATLRSILRARMKASPLLDAARLARNVEAAFRSAWRRWCERTSAGGSLSPT